jgi:hypothetical protein
LAGNNLAVAVNLTFKPANIGLLSLYMDAIDSASLSSGWQVMGSWTGNAALFPSSAPQAFSVAPASGTGMGATFSFVAKSAIVWPSAEPQFSAALLVLDERPVRIKNRIIFGEKVRAADSAVRNGGREELASGAIVDYTALYQ